MYQAFKSHAQVISLPHLGYDASTPESAFQVIGGSIQVPGLSTPLLTNLTLLDSSTGKPILQRFKPTSYKKKVAASKSATRGLDFYKVAQETDKGKKTSRGHIHLGIWSEQGNFKYNFTSGTTHNANSVPLLTWARDHSNEFLNHLLPFIHSDWHENLDSRPAAVQWLKDHFKEQAILLPDYWTACTFFNTFTGKVHDDGKDAVPSFLFNFGSSTMVRIVPYGVDVQMDPYDVLVFNTSLKHMTYEADVVTEGGSERWAFSGFIRDTIRRQVAPSNISASKLEQTHPPKKRFRSAAA